MNSLNQLLSLIITPPGNLLFHLVLAFSVLFAFQSVVSWPLELIPAARRSLNHGLIIILAGQIVLFVSAALAWQNLIPIRFILPSLERTVLAITLLWLGRLWLFPLPNLRANRLSLALTILLLLLFLIETLLTQSLKVSSAYTISRFDQIWTGLIVTLAGMSLIVAFIRPNDNPASEGFAFMGLILLGGLLFFALDPRQSDAPAYLRLAQLCAFPLLPALIQRIMRLNASSFSAETPNQTATPPTSAPKPSIQSIFYWGDVACKIGKNNLLQELSRAIAHTFQADLSLLLRQDMENPGRLRLEAGYDLVRDEPIGQNYAPAARFPKLSNALNLKKPLLIPSDSSWDEDQALATLLGLEHIGSMLAVPFQFTGSDNGLVVLLTPYSNHTWTPEELTRLQLLSQKITAILNLDSEYRYLKDNAALIEQQLQALQDKLDRLQKENEALRKSFDVTQASLAVPANDLEVLLNLQRTSQDTIEALQAENRALKEMLAESQQKVPSSIEIEHLENELRSTLEEVARLQNALAEANIQILKLQQSAKQPYGLPSAQQEVLISLIQEMRQPLSSILGYVDLLMGETIGILSALQRKFLERTRVATIKSRDLLEQLLEVISSLTQHSIEVMSATTEVGPIIDQVLNDLAPQFQQYEISIRLDLPSELPKVRLNPDNLYQILIQLLQQITKNMSAESELTVRALTDMGSNASPFLVFQISIASWENEKNLSRRILYGISSIEEPQAQIGKEELNLGLVKALIEANGGRVYVDNDTFTHATVVNILLPVATTYTADKIS
ncbi:hypothetical protein QYE77_00595 [Thermanaerothrix sp. 4228-RoL]|uniref:histidine kinase n=2 Tax=Thermanaerothrix TaxID=1077886 RepID=A0ABU3NIR2_9CHLR|nr:GAF domain-containing protein [Thermanaerothrix sp. 4228-RoL]MDT8896749.1 hypothetical protein [Thermanaerothrix sp. 4228-RoL]